MRERHDQALILDAPTRRNLELEQALGGKHELTLAGIMDRCRTPMGSRLLRSWINRPIRDPAELGARQAAIEALMFDPAGGAVGESLADLGDLERILARVALRSARPRDLVQLREGLARLPGLKDALAAFESERLAALDGFIEAHTGEHALLARALVEEPPVVIRDGGVIADGYDPELDELRAASLSADTFLDRAARA